MTNINNMFNQLQDYLEYPFVKYALIVGVLISLCSSLFGATLILKRLSFIGNGLANVAFGATAVATVVGLSNNVFIVLPITVLSAVLLLKGGHNNKINGDTAVALISVGALAVGYLIMSIFSVSTNFAGDVCSIMFGSTSILTLTKTSVWVCVILSIIVILMFILLYNKIFAVTFDEEFAKATGVNSTMYNYFVALIIAIIIVLAMNLVGSLLISALVIFPATSAMRVFKSYKSVVIASAIISVTCSTIGILASILFGTPVGSTIVAVNIVVFGIFYVVGLKR